MPVLTLSGWGIRWSPGLTTSSPAGPSSPEAYGRQLRALLPRGAAWMAEAGTRLAQLLDGLATELSRVDGRAGALVDERDPRTAIETLADWERLLGLPDDCLLTIPSAIAERQTLVALQAVSLGGQTAAFYVELAARIGFTVTVTEFHPFRAGDHCGDRCYGTAWAFAWQVNVPVGAITVFHAGSHAGERLRGWGAIDLECIIHRAAPAHTTVLFAYS